MKIVNRRLNHLEHILTFKQVCTYVLNSIEVDVETKESTRKTGDKLDGRYKAMNERNLNGGQWEDRKQWGLGVGQCRTF